MNSPITSSITSRLQSMNMPSLRVLIFRILMLAIIVHTASTSLTIHIPPVTQQSPVTATPTMNDTRSRSLTGPNLASLSFLFLRSHRVSDVQIITPIMPTLLPTTLRITLVMCGKKQAMTDATTTMMLNTVTNILLTLMPNPLQDQARLYMEEAVMAIVQKQSRMNKPHSKGLQNCWGQQLTRYWNYVGGSVANATTTQLIQFLPGSEHPLSMRTGHEQQSVSQCTGLYLPWMLATDTPWV